MEPLEAADKPRSPDLIYVVEDDPDVSRLIEHNLRTAGYEVSTFFSGGPVVPRPPWCNPRCFFSTLCCLASAASISAAGSASTNAWARRRSFFFPPKAQEPDRLQAFDVGGDGFITKPFSPRELIARIRNVLRGRPDAPTHEIIQVGELEIDIASMTVRVRGRMVLTTVREFRLLEYLARHRGRVFTRDQLLDAVWKEGSFVTPRSIDVFVRRLREKIERDPRHPRYLKTLRGIGYRFEAGR